MTHAVEAQGWNFGPIFQRKWKFRDHYLTPLFPMGKIAVTPNLADTDLASLQLIFSEFQLWLGAVADEYYQAEF